MYIAEKYTMLKMIDQLINHQFEVRYISNDRDLFILERYEKKTSHIILLNHKQFDWANHLRRDVHQKVNYLMKKLRFVRGRTVHYHIAYFSDLAPVDRWEDVRETKSLTEKKNAQVSVYYFNQGEKNDELSRLSNQVNEPVTDYMNLDLEPISEEMDRQTVYLEQKVVGYHRAKEREFKQVFFFGKTRLTYLLILANLFVFALIELNGSSTDTFHLIEWGAKYNPAIADGDWWRIVSSMFLHIGALHLFMNMLALFFLGDVAEKIYGTKRFLIIYFLAGIFGGMASFATNDAVAAGASGAIFGLFGALLFFGLNYRELFFKTMGTSLLIIIGINIVFGFTVPQIDNGAHLGGLIGGFLAAQIVQLPYKKGKSKQLNATILFILLITSMTAHGVNHAETSEDPHSLALIAQQHVNNEEYDRAVRLLTNAIDEGINHEYLYFYRSVAHIEQNELSKAEEDLYKAIELDPHFSEAFYNLGVLYEQRGEHNKAKEYVEKAIDLNPDQEQFRDFYDQLSD
ncbi:rhomboid family intramembrane serine protease [Alkalibacillus haloalkaliphilus]|uniref:rhomboid family intramembrane serine protease n=1 Tax=Alkalibacillus haloalkaliphilus TaxID=94136 RepID=UPI0002DDB364|nr:rhomboid family intramembrane serine protease [Alkalibacillus haloalkaliphilus]